MLSWETSLEQISVEAKPCYRWFWFQRERFQEPEPDFQVCWWDEDCYKIRCDLILWNERECCFRTIFLLLLQSNTEEVMCCLQELTIICRCGLFLSQQNAFLWHLKDTDCRPDQGTSAGHQDAPYIDLNGRLGVPFWPRKEESHWGHLLHDIQKSHQPVK